MTVHHGSPITKDDMDAIVMFMDDDLRERLHLELAPCSYEEFLEAYIKEDYEFLELLEWEFGFSMDD